MGGNIIAFYLIRLLFCCVCWSRNGFGFYDVMLFFCVFIRVNVVFFLNNVETVILNKVGFQ